jgi:SAM-dependent methyltransferase
MTDKPLNWHYGLMAERVAEFKLEAPELPFFLNAIARFGQPVLDVPCGAGRLLVPLARAGIDIDGCDISGDMLGHCRQKADREGLHPHLYEGAMHAFALPRKYKTIYICDSFGLAGSRENDLETLRRCYMHLEDGGALLVNIEAEYTSPEAWDVWLCKNCQALPEPWPEEAERRVAPDGSEYLTWFRFVNIDPLEQSFTRQVRIEKRLNDQLVASEEYFFRGNMYLKNELLLMLKVAGFHDITVVGDYMDKTAALDSEELVFTAIK